MIDCVVIFHCGSCTLHLFIEKEMSVDKSEAEEIATFVKYILGITTCFVPIDESFLISSNKSFSILVFLLSF